MASKDVSHLHNMYNATSTEDPPGSDELETYQAWLERQLLARLEKIDKMEKVLAADRKALLLAQHEVPKTIGEPRHFNRTWQLIKMALDQHKLLNL